MQDDFEKKSIFLKINKDVALKRKKDYTFNRLKAAVCGGRRNTQWHSPFILPNSA
jgi:hypothetical protein